MGKSRIWKTGLFIYPVWSPWLRTDGRSPTLRDQKDPYISCSKLSNKNRSKNRSATSIHTWSRYSSVGITTSYGFDGPGIESRLGARFSAPVQTGSEAHPASYTMGTGSFQGIKRTGCGVDHSHPSSAKVKERVELYLYSLSGSSMPVLWWTYLYLYLYIDPHNWVTILSHDKILNKYRGAGKSLVRPGRKQATATKT